MDHLVLQIAIGIWLGGIFLAATVVAVVSARDWIVHQRRYGRSWRRAAG